MTFWPASLKEWAEVITPLLALGGGGWGLYQYFNATRLKAAETLLKVEEEFRNIFSTYEEIEDASSYKRDIKPVLEAERKNHLDSAGLVRLTQLDRCLRFLYLCSVLNETLRADRAIGVEGGALRRAYYYYIGILLPQEKNQRPELFAYVERYYPRLLNWVRDHEGQLIAARKGTREVSSVSG